ncbi:hypothetical protein LVD15_07230 [Fulvivirga maritima]|uniref:hypothetical protein n=1 Tax=Fulvivirga maritima TaxID=2904247 RepID=UPI001F1EE776|nr:hypothetical protein [Fulvivirga maritima]UII28210.1 hypothetical protein LVD15_07230 [Fulvivirga maritima]
MNHTEHSKKVAQPLAELVKHHQEAIASFENVKESTSDPKLQEYCDTAIALRNTLIEDLKDEIDTLTSDFNVNKRMNVLTFGKLSRSKMSHFVEKVEKSIVGVYMQVIRSNTFSNTTESILKAQLETLRNRLKLAKKFSTTGMLHAA